MKRLGMLLCVLPMICWGQAAPSDSRVTTAPADRSLNGNASNTTLYASNFPGVDIGAKVNAAMAACARYSGCSVVVSPGAYNLATTIDITADDVTLSGYGATLTGNGSLAQMIHVTGSYDAVTGFAFSTNGSKYGIASNGIGTQVQYNKFGGPSGIYVAISGSPRGADVSHNRFDGSTGCASAYNVSVYLSAWFNVGDNHSFNTCGFAYVATASENGDIHDNEAYQQTQKQNITASGGQTDFVFHWPTNFPPVSRVWPQVDGVPVSATRVTYSAPYTTTLVLPAQTTGATVTGLGWTGLESIQVNSQSFGVTVHGNKIQGSGDAGIDVVSDFHLTSYGTATAMQNQQIFSIPASVSVNGDAVAVVDGRILPPGEASLVRSGRDYTITLDSPQPAGTVVTLQGLVNVNGVGSNQGDFPGEITIANNVVAETASACIATEVSAKNIVISENVMRDCGQGVATTAYSSGVFTGGASPLIVANNVFSNTTPVASMNRAISIQNIAPDPGTIEKPIKISGNVYQGVFSHGPIEMATIAGRREQGIDIAEGPTIPYPEQVNLDDPWDTTPVNTRYFRYTHSSRGASRDTSRVIGGVASAFVNTDALVDITPTNQIFFQNSIAKVTFWARQVSGTPSIELWSTLAGNTLPVTLPISDNKWKQYSIYLSMEDLDPVGMFLRLDGKSGSMNVQNITFSAVPIRTGDTAAVGTSSSVGNNQKLDSISIGAGASTNNSSSIPQTGTTTPNRAACVKAAGPPVVIGYCSTAVDRSGVCTCN